MVLIISKANGLMVRFWGRLVVVWFGVVLLLEALGGLGLAVQPVRLGVGGGCVVWVVLLLGAFGGLGWLCFGWSGWFCFWGVVWGGCSLGRALGGCVVLGGFCLWSRWATIKL